VMRLTTTVTLLSVLLGIPAYAAAACRTTTCDQQNPPANCAPLTPGGCNTSGIPIAWPNTCVSSSVSAHGSPLRNITADQMRGIVQAAFQQWTSVKCANGEPPSFVVDMFPDVNCTDVTGDAGYKSAGPNYNIWIFHDTDWPYDVEAERAIALTTVQFNPSTGEIYDADVELNSQTSNFTTGLDFVDIDLPSVVQHESGHFLGLAHTPVSTATMLATLNRGEVSKRILDPDDVAGICAAYPPGNWDPTCDPEPRHGFSTECNFTSGGCAIAATNRVRHCNSLASIVAGLCLAVIALRRRKPLRADTTAKLGNSELSDRTKIEATGQCSRTARDSLN